MSRPESARIALAAVPSIPRDDDGPVFPAPWAARAFAFTLALHERDVFTWPQWAEALGAAIRDGQHDSDPESYWLCWLSALESLLAVRAVAEPSELATLRAAWRQAAAETPHGEPIELKGR
ncbi:MAG TPA: nitrile hydratase accessory protein [Afifellaceae bacterium]|nr:nitrile hydratase accessory protein [Afifellaceae bacterium]